MLKRVNKGCYCPRFKQLFHIGMLISVYRRRLQYLVEHSFVKFNEEIYCITLVLNHNPSKIIIYYCDRRKFLVPVKTLCQLEKNNGFI